MSEDTTEENFDIIRSGYERFFNDSDDVDCGDTIVTVHRQEQITTHFGPMTTTKNKIKVSLSQEQIVNRLNGIYPGIKRSQSINIQKFVSPSERLQRIGLQRRGSLKPSMIPIKVNEPLRLCAPPEINSIRNIPSSRIKYSRSDDIAKQRQSMRKFSIPLENQTEHEMNLSSLPIFNQDLTMTQSMNASFGRDVLNSLPEKFKCGICFNTLTDPRVLDCLHTFCLECLFGVENSSKTTSNKVNLMVRSNSRDSSDIDMSSSNPSDLTSESKELNKKTTKTSISALSKTTNPIKKIFSSTVKKRPETERKVSFKINVDKCNLFYI